MDAQNVMEEWEVSSFDGGFDGLADLQSRRFSGAVEAGGTWLFFRDGDPVAVVDDLEVDPRPGDVDAFEGASGQLHEATHPATATLAPMLALGGEVRGQYFTEDTPLSTVHETLSEGGFTGYVELSENVLSGDYFVVYDDGAEDYLGVLGSSQRLITDDEAQSKAEGEVGIYSVVAISLPDVEIPAAETTAAGAVGAGDPDGSTVAAGEGEEDDATDPGAPDESTGDADAGPALEPGEADDAPDAGATPEPASEPESGTSAGAESEAGAGTEPATDAEPADGGIETGPPPGDEADVDPDPEEIADSRASPGTETAAGSAGSDGSTEQGQPESSPENGSRPTEQPASTERHEQTATGAASTPEPGGSSDSVLEGVTTRSVPSLDPERTGRAESARQSIGGGTREPGAAASRAPADEVEPEPEPEQRRDAETNHSQEQGGVDDDRIEAVREEYEARIEDLEAELASLREERDRLRERVSELESGGAPAPTASGGPALSAAEALAGTSLFVREGTRGEATLEDAHAGRTDRETLANNLRIEYHTQFEDDEASVDGEGFDSWLRTSAPYDFVEWLITDLLFEIQSTGASSALRPLYDAIPRIDRIGFEDPITVGEGEETREVTFDVVARNQMGEPLVAATIDEGREPTHAESLQPLITDAEDVALEHDTLAATFSVTSSYFEPDALDAAREATSGSLLGRDRYRSYVKLARKQGFHLCLVESREESFHLAVPEL